MTTVSASSPQDQVGWSNWDGRQNCFPQASERPRDIEELRGALDRARQAGRNVRVAGSGHSFTGLVPTNGSLISLERMNRVLEVDPTGGLVRVEAGITIGQLNTQLDRHGLRLREPRRYRQAVTRRRDRHRHPRTGSRLRNLSSQLHAVS